MRKKHKLLKYVAALILVFPGLCLFGKPQSVLAHIVGNGSQILPASIHRDVGVPFLTHMATSLAAITPDTANTNEDQPIDINVLSNDGGPTTINSLIPSGTLGSISINSADQTIHYDPTIGLNYLQDGQVYTDTFQYTVISGTLQTTTVEVGVTGVNDNPIALNDVDSTGENAAADFTNLLTNDSDPDTGDTALLTIQSVDTTGGTKGTVTINSGGKSVHYDPGTAFDSLGAGQTAEDTFGYTVSDPHGGTATATVTVTINGANDNPIALNDVDSTDENTAADFTNLLTNDSDPDAGDTALLTIQSVNTTGGTKGTVTINTGGKSVHYDPGTAFDSLGVGETAEDTFGYTVTDGHGGTASATVTVTVNGVNDPPSAVNDTYTTDENTASDLNILSNDTDLDTSDVLTIQSIDTTGTLGQVMINSGNTTVHYDPTVVFNNLKNGQKAIDTFQYTISDGHGTTSTATVTVNVNGLNDNPTPVNDTATTGENTATDINVVSNDTDPEGDTPLTVTGINTTGTLGSVSINSDNTVHYDPGTAFDSLAVGDTGSDTFQYTISDGQGGSASANVTVTIIGANDNPTPGNDTVSTGENTAANFNVLTNDTDPDTGDTALLTIQSVDTTGGTKGVVTINSGGLSVHYDPGMAFNSLGRSQTADDSFGYTVSDGHGGSASATVTVTVIGANDPPVAIGDTYTTPANKKLTVAAPGVLANDSDPDSGDALTGVLVTYPSHGVLAPMPLISGGFVYTPTVNYHGIDHFVYHASDGLASSNNVTVTIGVSVTNQAPIVVADTATTQEDTPIAIPVTANDRDPDGSLDLSTLKVSVSPSHGTTQVNTTTGRITYQPALNYNGIDTFRYQIYDKDSVLPLSGSAPVTVTVTPVNDPPQAANFQTSTAEDTPEIIDLSGYISDVDNNLNLSSLQVITPAGHGTAVKTGNPIITYTPAPNYNGQDVVGYRICDLGALCAQAKITISVTPVNDPPVAVNDQYYTQPITLTVKAPGLLTNDYDVDTGDQMKAEIVTEPINGQLKLNEDGSFIYTPRISSANDRFRYQVHDSQGALSNTATVTITVDASPPDVNWQSPMNNGGIYYAYTGQQVPLLITATDDAPIARVEFFWWDPKAGGKGGFVDIANILHAPFRALVNVSELNIGWNQIFARAYDAAGNVNSVVDPAHPGFIWVIRQEKIYFPLVSLVKSP